MSIKKLIFVLLVISSIGCKNYTYDLSFDISQNKLFKLFYSNKYYKENGFDVTFNNKKYNLSKPGSFLVLESKENEFNGFNKIILFDIHDTIELNLHNYIKLKSFEIDIKFNAYTKRKFQYLPFLNSDVIEKLKNRNTLIFTKNSNDEIKINYQADGFENIISSFSENKIYESTSINFIKLQNLGLFPKSSEDTLYVYNSLEDKFSVFPNYNNFKILNSQKKSPLKLSKIVTSENNENIIIENDTIITEVLSLKNIDIHVRRGIKIFLDDNASLLLDNVQFKFYGDPNQSTKFISKDTNSIYIKNSKKIIFDNIFFNGFSNLNSDLKLPSAITFYNSNVEIQNCVFSNNKRGDDFINFFNSTFLVNESTFEKTLSDAIDSDFSTGKITNSNFYDIGNDAIDLSGSNVDIVSNKFYKSGDKSISVGEKSYSLIMDNKFFNNEIAIVVKDESFIEIVENFYRLNKIDLVGFVKKEFFEAPTINFNEPQKDISIIIEKNVCLNNYSSNIEYFKNVDKLLYGNLYGKASR